MSTRDDLSDSLENYLEAILELEETQKVARAKEIADRLKIQRGSVTGGLKTLSEKGYNQLPAVQLYYAYGKR